ncbi:MAG: ATP-dependent RecD-like DNA helicase [Bacilli bacterium]|nr:ATP-dependent RecD-like DNA helicase [Bacilli bacterium]
MKSYIKGTYSKTIFKSDNGYIIGLFKIKETNIDNLENSIDRTITFTGYFHDLTEGDPYIFYGEEVRHPKYGDQFKVINYDRVKPEGKDGMIEFLSSELFPGVGAVTATSIVNTLGDNALDKIISDESCLKTVPKLSKKLINMIYENLIQYEESHKTIVALCDMGFAMKDALSIYNVYGSNTINYLEHNIYCVIDDIPSISFVKVDQMARIMDIDPTNENRVKAAIIYLIEMITFSTGDSYLEYEILKVELEKFLNIGITDEILNEYFNDLEMELKIVIDNNKYYLYDLYEAESNIVETIKFLKFKSSDNYKNIEERIDKLEQLHDITYNEMQKKAIITALENNVSIITGGPGTGKTTIIKVIVDLYKILNKLNDEELTNHLALLAPTGRASKRMSDSTILPAMTIHRFLKWNKDTDQFAVNEYNKDNSKLVIIDESSMVDIMLLDNLFKGLTKGIKLVLVGDYHQLPSVSPGQILKDLVISQKIETVELDLLYRQSEDSYIPILAKEIKDGELLPTTFSNHSDYQFRKCPSNSIINHLKGVLEELKDNGYDYNSFQIMAPIYRGINGIDNLNKELQKVLNPTSKDKTEYIFGNITFRVNDKVIQLVNVPDQFVYNGDIGLIKQINHSSYSKSKKTEILVDYDGNIVTYYPQTFIQLRHAFAISIHKAQGSEFPVVIIPMCPHYQRMLYRKLIYTGVTRAKDKLYIIGEPDAFAFAIKNTNEYDRKSDLINKIMNNL